MCDPVLIAMGKGQIPGFPADKEASVPIGVVAAWQAHAAMECSRIDPGAARLPGGHNNGPR